MQEKINQLGGNLHKGNIRCERCIKGRVYQAGGFDPNYGILLCANNLRNRSEVEDSIAHGMLYAVSE